MAKRSNVGRSVWASAVAMVIIACGPSEPEGAAPASLVRSASDLTEDTCSVTVTEGTAEFRCPDGSGCADLHAFGVSGTHCEADRCPVCPKDPTKPLQESLPCPEGEFVCANFTHPVTYFCCTT